MIIKIKKTSSKTFKKEQTEFILLKHCKKRSASNKFEALLLKLNFDFLN